MTDHAMTATQIAIIVVYAVIVAVWPIRLAVLEIILHRQQVLTPQSPHFDRPDPPLVSAILPAKDEETHLPDCLQSVRRQTYPNLEILVVDDRSTDRTGAIARDIAATDPRIRVLTIDELPEGWTGKTHALDSAARCARGDWLLFLDADTLHSPQSLGIMMEFARAHGAALVSLLPELRCETFWERVMQPLAAITLMQSFPLDAVNSVHSPLAFANGQYILINRTAYDAAGGHREVRDRFVEDIAIAQRVKALGLPIRVALARGIVSCRMYSSLKQLVVGWSRIYYDALERKPVRLALKLLDPIVFCQTGHLALAVSLVWLALDPGGKFARLLLCLGLVHHVLMFLVFLRVYRTSLPSSWWAVWYPVANLIADLILFRSLRMCFTGQVTWRGTDYGIASASPRLESREDSKPH
jgi:chlorobactene glucosyltransferase